ncbi:MAG TPA: sugar transferase [Acidobacteriaceae bacterium]
MQSIPKADQDLFCPHHVSAWCMSKRKRLLGLVCGAIALILFAPLMLLIGLLIKITSKGPVLFRQQRVGLHQQPFIILKFRTMDHHDEEADKGLTVTRHGDPRMTGVGAVLRRLKWDELPQLINVVRGEMSLVGPRPKIPQHETLSLLCRPGITGAATIEFSDEERLVAHIPAEFVEHHVMTVLNPQKCRIDAHYIETASFRTDLRILRHTLLKLGKRPTNRMAVSPPPAPDQMNFSIYSTYPITISGVASAATMEASTTDTLFSTVGDR